MIILKVNDISFPVIAESCKKSNKARRKSKDRQEQIRFEGLILIFFSLRAELYKYYARAKSQMNVPKSKYYTAILIVINTITTIKHRFYWLITIKLRVKYFSEFKFKL